MRILQVHTTYREAGGEDRAVAEDAAVLREAGHDVTAIGGANPDTTLRALGSLALAPANPRAARAVAGIAKHVRPDVAHVHNTWFTLSPLAVTALARMGVPIVLTLHNYRLICPAATLFHHGRRCHDCVGTHPWHAVRHRCYRDSRALSAAAAATVAAWRRTGAIDAITRFVTLTDAQRRLFVAAGFPDDRIAVRPNTVTDHGPRQMAPSASDTVLFVGRLSAEKGIQELVVWWTQRPRPLRLMVIGDGPLRADLQRRFGDRVSFAGTLPPSQVQQQLRTARALWVPSVCDETFGMSVVEAMAAGLPVVTSGLGGLADLHGPDAGWVAPPGEPRRWEAALAALTEDEQISRASTAGRRTYEARFTPAHGLATLEAVYADAIRAS